MSLGIVMIGVWVSLCAAGLIAVIVGAIKTGYTRSDR